MERPVPAWVLPAVIAGAFLLLLFLEARRPLRHAVESKPRRVARNLTTAGIAAAVVTLLQTPILLPVSEWAMRNDVGLLRLVSLPAWARTGLAVLLLDYTLWHWHRLNHKAPFLWRFHSVHHVDRDLDSSTGLRFHFGEMGLSVGLRAMQIVAIGPDPLSVGIYQILLFASVLFHHSNIRLPISAERILVRLIVTPRMHGIHHSDYRNEADANWSSLFSIWDYLHGTACLNVPQSSVSIGVPAYQDPDSVTLGKILALPFRAHDRDWVRADGSSHRAQDAPDRTTLSS